MARITLPNKWTPRDYQIELFSALDAGIKRAIIVWHRRSGKDSCCFNYLAMAAHKRKANYWHLFPTARQGRKALWEAVDKQGRRVIDQALPLELRDSTRNDEMLIRLKCGSTIQVTGADQTDSLVGSNPAGVVFSEYALTSPIAWRFIEPILIENGGWAVFNSTPRGKNHLFQLYETNKVNPAWFTSVRSWRDTCVITQADIDEAIRSGMPVELAEQEFNCSFNAPNVGIVYATAIDLARREGRIGDFPHDERYQTETWWDVGHRDATSIWFAQRMPNGMINIIDHFEERGKGLPYCANEVHKKPYSYSRHVGPHDLENKIWAVDASAQMIARNHGIHFAVAPKLPVAEGIGAGRLLMSRCRFNAPTTSYGLSCLSQYQYEWDEEKRMFTDKPVHDWASHASDAFRYGAVTPAGIGVVPDWAAAMMQQGQGMIGHNGGPPMQHVQYDPLMHWRGA